MRILSLETSDEDWTWIPSQRRVLSRIPKTSGNLEDSHLQGSYLLIISAVANSCNFALLTLLESRLGRVSATELGTTC